MFVIRPISPSLPSDLLQKHGRFLKDSLAQVSPGTPAADYYREIFQVLQKKNTRMKLFHFLLQLDQSDLHVTQVLLHDLLHHAGSSLLRLLQAAGGGDGLVQAWLDLGRQHQQDGEPGKGRIDA